MPEFATTTTPQTGSLAGRRGTERTATVAAALLAAVFGGFLLWGVGFAHADLIHNATHNTRHSLAFPCH